MEIMVIIHDCLFSLLNTLQRTVNICFSIKFMITFLLAGVGSVAVVYSSIFSYCFYPTLKTTYYTENKKGI